MNKIRRKIKSKLVTSCNLSEFGFLAGSEQSYASFLELDLAGLDFLFQADERRLTRELE